MDLEMNMDDYLPLRDVVFNTLRRAILKGELKPGERLMEIALADKLSQPYSYQRTQSVSWESAVLLSEKQSVSWSWKDLL